MKILLTDAEVSRRLLVLYDMALEAFKRAFTVDFTKIEMPADEEAALAEIGD